MRGMKRYNNYNHQKNYLQYRTYREISRNPQMANAYWVGVFIGIVFLAFFFGMF